MNPYKLIILLNEAAQEIHQLRRRNEILAAKVEVMDSFMCVLHTKPAEHVETAAPDVAWQLSQAAEAIKANQPQPA